MKVLVTGATGQLGYDVCRLLEARGVEHRGICSAQLDITNADAVSTYLESYRPDAVIHCAAYTAVDKAEDNPECCFAVNEGGTRNIAGVCKNVGAKMLYLSTDYVFPGTGDRAWETDDKPDALNVYGASKLAGEMAIQELLQRYFIVRTAWLYGHNGSNFIRRLFQQAEGKDSILMVSDQIGSPTYTADLAPLLCDMIETEKYGVYHATNQGVCSRTEYAEEIFHLSWNPTVVQPVLSAEYVLPAKRPLNSRLSMRSLDEAGFGRLPDWRDALCRYLRESGEKKKVLVTGGTGYIGKHVVKVLRDAGYPVMVATTHPDAVEPGVRVCTEPIFSGASDIYDRMDRPDVCIHMAWSDGFVHNSTAHMANLSNHITYCKNMMDGGLPVLSCMGTMHEVGYWEGAIDENTPCNPLTQYGIAKNAMRQSLLLSAKDNGCILHWLRLYYIISDDINGSSIFAKLMQAAQAGKTVFPFTTGKNQYDFMEIDELARLIVLASLQTEITGVTNICTGKPESLASCIERFIQEHHLSIRLDYGKYPDRPYDSPGVWGDSTKSKRLLNMVTDFDKSIKKSEKWS